MTNTANKLKIKKSDIVAVLSGKDKGKTGPVMRTVPENRRVVVEKINVVKKTQKPTQKNPQGGIISIEKPIDISNVALVCPKCKQNTRVGYRFEVDKDNADKQIKLRVCRKCGKDID